MMSHSILVLSLRLVKRVGSCVKFDLEGHLIGSQWPTLYNDFMQT